MKAYFPKAFAPPHVKTEFDDIANKYLTQQMDQLALHQTDLNTTLRTANEQADKEIAAAKVRNQ
ncbi:MAG: hypothetical protein K0Q94_5967 [Paenibacillus sp.]|nr:hypothetical protein [Paenibacillus sp.]